MIIVDKTWDKIKDDLYYRPSPIQPLADKWIFYQFTKPSVLRISEMQIPTITNRKELERISLGNKWINRRNKLDSYIESNPNIINDIIKIGSESVHLYYDFPIYLKSPSNNICYERQMMTTDVGYHKGMSVIADVGDETIYMKHFDNVVYNATQKGYIRINEKEALMPYIREKKLSLILK